MRPQQVAPVRPPAHTARKCKSRALLCGGGLNGADTGDCRALCGVGGRGRRAGARLVSREQNFALVQQIVARIELRPTAGRADGELRRKGMQGGPNGGNGAVPRR